jgi:hypothetical protein
MKPRIILVSALIIMLFSSSHHVVYPIIDPSLEPRESWTRDSELYTRIN